MMKDSLRRAGREILKFLGALGLILLLVGVVGSLNKQYVTEKMQGLFCEAPKTIEVIKEKEVVTEKIVYKTKTKIQYIDRNICNPPEEVVVAANPEVVVDGQAKAEEYTGPTIMGARKKNRVQILAGYGPTKLSNEMVGPSVKINQEYNPMVGVYIQRELSDTFNVGVGGFSNQTYFMGLGVDF